MDEALKQVNEGLRALDENTRERLRLMFERSADRAAAVIRANAGRDGRVPSDALASVIGQIELILQELRDQQVEAIHHSIEASARNGSEVIGLLSAAVGVPAAALSALPAAEATIQETLQLVLNGIADDGLNLSDRIWRNWQGAREDLIPAISRAVMAGESAAQATRDFLRRGGVASDDLITKIEFARSGALSQKARELLATPEAQAYANALRVFRTEMDRANILAARAGMYATEGVVGTRFLLSPSHPRFDICDVHASVNLYGLGPGVYPPGASPLPAHPNTLSYEEVVFEWEVSDEDQQGRHDMLSWLNQRSDADLYGALGQSMSKVRALRAGLLQENEITLPWRELVNKYGQQVEG